jgi:acyl CoA:acetate/3-ketoacid CoA transferase alpha subunit
MSNLVATRSKVVTKDVVVERVISDKVDGIVVRKVVLKPAIEKVVRTFLWDNPEIRRAFREASEREKLEAEAKKRLRG